MIPYQYQHEHRPYRSCRLVPKNKWQMNGKRVEPEQTIMMNDERRPCWTRIHIHSPHRETGVSFPAPGFLSFANAGCQTTYLDASGPVPDGTLRRPALTRVAYVPGLSGGYLLDDIHRSTPGKPAPTRCPP